MTTDEPPGDAQALALALARGEVGGDHEFDRFIPASMRGISWRFWTPLATVARAVGWLDELGLDDVLDVGSGVGKFCVAAALMRTSGRFAGIEHRPELVSSARELAHRFAVADRVSFSVAAFEPAPLPRAAVYYLYNPFGENVAPDDERLDATVELSETRFKREIAAIEAFFESAPEGTHVLVYNGFGGRMPPAYRAIRVDYDLPNVLRLWVKDHAPPRRTRA